MKCDVAIVGAGPAGSSAAIRLANAGLNVVLIEKAKFPREKLCGEFISPECFPHFAELGVAAELAAAGGAELCETIFYGHRGKSVLVKSEWFGGSSVGALGLSRAEMDARLLHRAVEVGVNVLEETAAIGLLFDGTSVSGVRLKNREGGESTVESQVTVDASGRGHTLARHLVKAKGNGKAASFVAFKTHVSGVGVPDETCEIYGYRGGYGGCNRVENGYRNLCFIVSARAVKRVYSDPENALREVVFANPRAADVLASATAVKPWLAVPIEGYGRGKLVPAPGLLTIGDAAAFIDPFTGSGILMALESGKIAATTILEHPDAFDDLSAAYRSSYSSTFDRRLRTAALLRRAAFMPWAAELTVSALALSSGIRRRIARATR